MDDPSSEDRVTPRVTQNRLDCQLFFVSALHDGFDLNFIIGLSCRMQVAVFPLSLRFRRGAVSSITLKLLTCLVNGIRILDVKVSKIGLPYCPADDLIEHLILIGKLISQS